MAANKIKGITIEIKGETTALSKALTNVNKTTSSLQSELKDVEKLLKLDPSNTELLTQKQKLLADSVEGAKDKLELLRTAAEQAQEKLAKGDIGEDQFRALQREVIKAEQKLQSLTDQEKKLSKESDKTGDAIKDMTNDIEEAKNKTLSFGDVLGANVVADGLGAIASAAKDAATNIVEFALATDAGAGMIQAKLGVTAEEAERLGEVAQDVWKNAFGDSITDVVNSLAIVRQYLGDISDEDLQSIIQNAYMLSDVFGADIEESVRVLKVMMDNFGISSTDAFDLLVVGYQNGLDYSGEFLDTLKEYSPYFANMGITADEAMQMLIAGAENGAWSLDKVADSVKEFNIRIQDGSTATEEGLESIGINYDDLIEKINTGAITTGDAMQLVIEALKGMDDPIAQNIAGTALFGTQWEDVGADVVLSMGGITDSLDGVSGAAEEAGNAAYDNLGTKFTSAMREVLESITPALETLIDKIKDIDFTPVIDFISFIISNPGVVIAIAAIAAVIGALAIAGQVAAGLTLVAGGLAAIGGVIAANPIGILITVIGLIIIGLVRLWQTNEDFRNAIIGAWEKIKEVAVNVWTAISDFFTVTIPAAFQAVLDWLSNNWPALLLLIINPIAGAIALAYNNLEGFRLFVDNILTTIKQFFIDKFNAIRDFLFITIPAMIQSVQAWFAALPGKIWSAIVGAVQKISEWAANMKAKAAEVVPGIIETIKGFFEDLPGKIKAIGGNLITGLWNGIGDKITWLKNKITGLGGDIIKWVKDKFGIASPSKVFAEIGDFMAQGLGSGFVKQMQTVAKDITDSVPTNLGTITAYATSPIQTATAAASVAQGTEQAAANKSIVVNQYIYGEQTSYIKQQREAAKQLKKVAVGI